MLSNCHFCYVFPFPFLNFPSMKINRGAGQDTRAELGNWVESWPKG